MRGGVISRSGADNPPAPHPNPLPAARGEGAPRRLCPAGRDSKTLGAIFCPFARRRGERKGLKLDATGPRPRRGASYLLIVYGNYCAPDGLRSSTGTRPIP